jgi:hypothetical protein
VDGVFAEGAKLRGQVNYIGNTIESLDYDLYHGDEANAVLIYRESAKFPWRVYSDYTLVPGSLTNGLGYIKIDTLKKGDYAFAKGDTAASLNQLYYDEYKVKIFPNPTNDILNFIMPHLKNEILNISIYSELGQLFRKLSLNQNENGNVSIDVQSLPSGNYILKLEQQNGQRIGSAKFQVYD